MIENLRLGGTTAMTLDSTTTNIASGTTFTLSASQDPTQTAWCNDDNASCIDRSMLASNNTTNTKANMTSVALDDTDNTGIYSMGNYYNWYSATAGTGTYSMTSGNATGSICPRDWHLPTGGTNTTTEFAALDIAMGGTGNTQSTVAASNRWHTYPNNLIYSGRVYGQSAGDRGTNGFYWSSTAYSHSNFAYSLHLSPSGLSLGNSTVGKRSGSTVRCVAR